jgi:TolA protein
VRYGLIGSILLHCVVFGVVIFNFASAEKTPEPVPAPTPPPVSVEILSPGEFSQRQAGKQDAPADKPPVPPAETKAPEAPATAKKEQEPKPSAKPAPKEALAPPPPPKVKTAEAAPLKRAEEPPPQEKKPVRQPPKETERKPLAKAKPEEPRQDDAPKRAAIETPKPAPEPAKPAPDTRPFDANRIASLLQKDANETRPAPQSMQAAPSRVTADRQAAVIDRDPNAGTVGGQFQPNRPWRPASSLNEQARGLPQANAMTNASTDADILLSQISRQWDLPMGGAAAASTIITLRFTLGPDGMVVGEPEIVNPSRDPSAIAAASAAKRAIYRAQPFRFPPSRYEDFRQNTISFDPSEMFGSARG